MSMTSRPKSLGSVAMFAGRLLLNNEPERFRFHSTFLAVQALFHWIMSRFENAALEGAFFPGEVAV